MVCLEYLPYFPAALFGRVQVSFHGAQRSVNSFCEAAGKLLCRYLYNYVKYDHLKMLKDLFEARTNRARLYA